MIGLPLQAPEDPGCPACGHHDCPDCEACGGCEALGRQRCSRPGACTCPRCSCGERLEQRGGDRRCPRCEPPLVSCDICGETVPHWSLVQHSGDHEGRAVPAACIACAIDAAEDPDCDLEWLEELISDCAPHATARELLHLMRRLAVTMRRGRR